MKRLHTVRFLPWAVLLVLLLGTLAWRGMRKLTRANSSGLRLGSLSLEATQHRLITIGFPCLDTAWTTRGTLQHAVETPIERADCVRGIRSIENTMFEPVNP